MTFPKKIMLVNHEPRLTDLIRCALESTGRYRIRIQPDCRHALHAARWFTPDLILLDAMKAQAEGIDMAQLIHADASLPDTPLLFLNETMESSGVLNGYSFRTSPVRMDEIVRCVDEILTATSQAHN
jgi:DNA-binding response OmpR family regulator